MTEPEFREKMVPLWAFRNDASPVELDLEIMMQMQSVCIDYLSTLPFADRAQKLRGIFLMGSLIGYNWERHDAHAFCDQFLDVFSEVA